LDCDSAETANARIAAYVSLVVWGGCFPLFFAWLIRRQDGKAGWSFALVSTGYRPGFKNWECFECYKRLIFLTIISLFEHHPESGAVFLLFVNFLTTLVLFRASPFINSLINGARVCTDILLSSILMSAILFSARDVADIEIAKKFASFVFALFCVLWPAMALIFAAEAFSTNARIKVAGSVWNRFLYKDEQRGSQGLSAMLGRNIQRVSTAIQILSPRGERAGRRVSTAILSPRGERAGRLPVFSNAFTNAILPAATTPPSPSAEDCPSIVVRERMDVAHELGGVATAGTAQSVR
jgi:hypothetical protein